MDGSQQDLQDGARAAACVAGDSVFAALDASGAPIIALSGDPPHVSFVNESARAVFGDDAAALGAPLGRREDPGAQRLAALLAALRRGPSLRLERLRLRFSGEAQMVTFLCRSLGAEAGDRILIAALGILPDSLDKVPRGLDASAEAGVSDETVALRRSLAARHGARSPRFLWRTDAQGRFTDVNHALADVVGEAAADILGRSVQDASQALALHPAFGRAVASRRAWSGVEVDWPLEGESGRVPTTLGARPMMDSDRRFLGYQGYGVLHIDRVSAAESAAAAASPGPEQSPFKPLGDNVVVLRAPGPTRADVAGETLSSSERLAFDEIARALKGGGLVAPEMAPGAAEATSEPAQPPISARALQAAMDHLPVGVLIARADQTLFVNRALIEDLGYRDRAAFDASGGVARLFPGRALSDIDNGSIVVQASMGSVAVDARTRTIEWDEGQATLVTLRRGRERHAPGPEQSALALARAVEEKLARSKSESALLGAAFDCSRAPLAIIAADGTIVRATDQFAASFVADLRALEGRNLASLLSPPDAKALMEQISRAGPDGRARLSATLADAGGAGSAVELTLRRLPIDGHPTFVVEVEPFEGASPDERALEVARLAAESANAAKSDFLTRVSHEIRTPLNAIMGFAEAMAEERLGPIGSPRYKEYLRDMHASGAHVLSLVNDLLDLSKIEAGKMELSFARVDANAVIAECASIMQAQANQGRVVMRLALAPGLPPLRADARSLKQILLNLLSNAVKFNERGGQVIVSSALNDAGAVVIRVKDTGIGMSEEDVATAMEPFRQVETARKASGTGLGLPLTKALIEANHASFSIHSRQSEGTLIEITFPPPQALAAE